MQMDSSLGNSRMTGKLWRLSLDLTELTNTRMPDWWHQPQSRVASSPQLSLFPEATDYALATLRVSRDECRRWYEAEWLSFNPASRSVLSDSEIVELTFVRGIIRSGLSDAQVTHLLERLPEPRTFDPRRLAFSFQFGWVETPHPLDRSAIFALMDQHAWRWLESLRRARNIRRLQALSYDLRNLLADMEQPPAGASPTLAPSPRPVRDRVVAHVIYNNPGIYDYETILVDTDLARFHRSLADAARGVESGMNITFEEYFNLAEQPEVSDWYEGPDADIVREELASEEYTRSEILWRIIERRIAAQQSAIEAGSRELDGIKEWIELANSYLEGGLWQVDAWAVIRVADLWDFGSYLLERILQGLEEPRPHRYFAPFRPFRARAQELHRALSNGVRTEATKVAVQEWIRLYQVVIGADVG